MKKTFRSILAGALALLAVSCYDDSGLRKDIQNLDDRVTAIENVLNAEVNGINDLATRLAAAEQALTTANTTVSELVAQLDAVDGKVDGKVADFEAAIATLTAADKTLDDKIVAAIAKIAVVNVEEKDGNVVLTLADNTTVALSKPLANVDNANLVTITDDNMWAVVNADGTVTSLDIPVGHPDVSVEFQVSSTGELQYSVNGGEWEDTGVSTSDISGQKYVINDVILYDEEKCVVITIGDVEYTLPLYSIDSSVITIKSGKTYFSYGEEKTVDIVLSEISSMYVMSKPDGWKAKLSGKKLTVTAPLEANVLSGASEADGEVLLHCTTAEGKCKIASLAVATTPGFSLTVSKDGTIKIVNPEVTTISNMAGSYTDFNDAYIGLAPVAAFEANPVEYVANIQDNYDDNDDKWIYIANWKMNSAEMDEEWNMIYTIGGAYEPGKYEVDVIETTVPQMYADWTYGQEIPAEPFVVWACPMDDKGAPRTSDIVFGYYYPSIKATITAGAVSTSDVELSVNVVSADHYYVGLVTEEQLYGFPIDDYMQMQEGPFGYFQMALQYGMPDYAFQQMGTEFGGDFGEEMPEALTASMLNYGQPLMPNTKFYVWVFPVVDGLDLADYTYEDNLKPYIYEFQTENLQPGGSAVVVFGDTNVTFTSMSVELAAEGATMIYYNYFTPDQYNAFEDDASMSAALLANGYVFGGGAGSAVNRNDIAPGVEYYLVSLAVDAEGKYGDLTTKLYTAPAITFSETFKATFGEAKSAVYYSGYKYDFPIAVEGGEAAKYYYVWSETEYTDEQLANLPLTYNYDYSFRSTTNVSAGQLAGQYANASSTYYLAVVVESTTGELSPVIKMTVEVPAVPAAE